MKIVCLLLIVQILQLGESFEDPYLVLGVGNRAKINDIKRSYKLLAKKWHPDKNDSPDAEHRFIEINKAYELLSDPQRREEFDKYGVTEDSPNFRNKPDYSNINRYEFDPFESFFTTGSGGYQFKYTFNQGNVFYKQTITSKAYENHILPGSGKKPHVILFYGDLCIPCFQAEPLWQKIVQDLEPIGVAFATIHTQHESALARKIGVTRLPYIVVVVDGVARHYKQDQLSQQKLTDFIRRVLPSRLITPVNDANYINFLSGFADNRIRALFVNSDKVLKLRYLLTAFQYRENVACGDVNLNDPNIDLLKSLYTLDSRLNSMLIFNEDFSSPTATLTAPTLDPQIMKDMLEAHKYLMLPRLSSQEIFDRLCPVESVRSRRSLCVVLVTNDSPDHQVGLKAMRSFVREHSYSKGRVKFMYIFGDKQTEFVKSLSIGTPIPPALHVIVIWRREQDKLLYEWLNNRWDMSDIYSMNETKKELHILLSKLAQNTQVLPNKAHVVALIDEHASGLFGRILKKMLIISDGISDGLDGLTKQEILPILSVVLSIAFIVFIGYIMQYLVKIEEETIQERYRKLGRTPPGTKTKPDQKLNVHELRGETYNGLVRLLKPGCRTMVLLCDHESKPKLLSKFYRCVYPYRRNKTLMFAHILVEKNVEWYKNILQQALGNYRELNINPKNCIGTVLALNGFRKYFCVYHAKHPENTSVARSRNRDENGGAFMGFDDETDEDCSDVESGNLVRRRNGGTGGDDDNLSNSILFEENLLDGLTTWLERLFEGTTHRYHIQYWPDHMK